MSFPEDSYSIVEKLQARGLRLPVLVGLIVIAAIVLVLLGQMLWGLVTGDALSSSGIVVTASETSDGQTGEDSSEAASGQASGNVDSGDSSSENQDSNATESAKSIFVDVVGQVKHPGMYELTEGARLATAVEMAGGFTKKADRASVNQAQVLTDGQQIVVAEKQSDSGASSSSVSASASSGKTSANSGSAGASAGGKVNINTASADELTSLSGIGDVTARKIIADRESNGAFKKPEDIKRVSGIGDKRYEAIADFICV